MHRRDTLNVLGKWGKSFVKAFTNIHLLFKENKYITNLKVDLLEVLGAVHK